jgi:hypothetical protein
MKKSELRQIIREEIENIQEEKWSQNVIVKKGEMHKVLGIPEDKKISDVYNSGEKLVKDLINKVGRKKAAGMINYVANINSSYDIFDDAQSALNKIEKK